MKNYFLKFTTLVLVVLSFFACANQNQDEGSNSLYRILVGDKYGFIDANGKIVIEPQYDDAFRYFSENLCCVTIENKRYLINEKGTIVKEYADSIRNVSDFIDGIAVVTATDNNGGFISWISWGIINSMGEMVIPAINYSTRVNKDGNDTYICVRENDTAWYMADKMGKIIGPKCDSILSGFNNGLCAVKQNGKWGYMDTQGNIVIDAIYDYARIFTEDGLARVRKDNKHMFLDRNGNSVFSVDSSLTGFNHNRAAVILNGDKCLINKQGYKVCGLDCDRITPFDDDFMATIIKDGKASRIDTTGNIVLETDYDFVSVFYDGLAAFRNNGKWGLCDMAGKEIVAPIYEKYYQRGKDKLFIFSSKVYDISSFSYYDKTGTLLWQDLPQKKVECPRYCPTRKDFVEYFDANISRLDPIEGIYYVTDRDYYQDRDNLSSIGLNNTKSQFYAVAREDPNKNEFWAFCIDGSNKAWVNKFIKLGDSNNYAIVKRSDEYDYSSEGRVTIEDPNSFDFRLETGKNNWYNFFVTYEFIRDYPPVSDYEQFQQAEWTGTGFAIADGYIATNHHVTNGAKMIRIKGINGDMEKSYKGYLVTSDKEHDLSVIKIVDPNFEGFGKIPYSIGKTTVDVGDNIFVLGYPLISSMGNEIKLTDGVISSSTGFRGDESMYQISAPVQPGNSGGPLFNEDGTIVGVVCAKHSKAENANYAVKISYLYSMLETSGYNIEMASNNSIKKKKLSTKVKSVKDFVFLIECSSK